MKIRQSVVAHLLKENKDVCLEQTFADHRRTASTEAYQQTGLETLKLAVEQNIRGNRTIETFMFIKSLSLYI